MVNSKAHFSAMAIETNEYRSEILSVSLNLLGLSRLPSCNLYLGSAQASQMPCCFGCVVGALCRFVSPDNNSDNTIASRRLDRQRSFHRL